MRKYFSTPGKVTTCKRFPATFSWYLSFFDGHAQMLIGPAGWDCDDWRELGPVDMEALQRDDAGTWQKAILQYGVNRHDYRCKVASVPFTGDLPHDFLVKQLKQKGIL